MSAEEEIIVTIDMNELKKMKVPELKKKLTELGLPTKGTKAELLARVEKYVHEQEEEELLEDVVEEEEEEEEEEEVDGAQEGEQEKTPPESKPPAPVVEGEAEEEKAENENNSTATKKRTVSTSSVGNCQADRLAQRAAKFGVNTSEEAKKIARAERFGTALENNYKGLGKRPTPSGEELEKLKKRAERFGSSVSPAITNLEEDDKKKKRMERFGMTTTELSVQERKKLRAARFGTS